MEGAVIEKRDDCSEAWKVCSLRPSSQYLHPDIALDNPVHVFRTCKNVSKTNPTRGGEKGLGEDLVRLDLYWRLCALLQSHQNKTKQHTKTQNH
eukprot:scaffold8150_cov118-Cylindrotheca_fusiformis.AAC.10